MVVSEVNSEQNLMAQLYGPQLNRERLQQTQQAGQSQPPGTGQNNSQPANGVEVNISAEARAQMRLGVVSPNPQGQGQTGIVTPTGAQQNNGQYTPTGFQANQPEQFPPPPPPPGTQPATGQVTPSYNQTAQTNQTGLTPPPPPGTETGQPGALASQTGSTPPTPLGTEMGQPGQVTTAGLQANQPGQAPPPEPPAPGTGNQVAGQSQTQAVDEQNMRSAAFQGLSSTANVVASTLAGSQPANNQPQGNEANSNIAPVQAVEQANTATNSMPMMVANQTYRGMASGLSQQNATSVVVNA